MPHLNLDKLVQLAQSSPLPVGTSQFYFLRHGETDGNAARVFQRYDARLSPLGEKQAIAAADALANEPVKTLFVSDATRTLQTAEPIASALGLEPSPVPELKERHFGQLWGQSSITIDWDCAPKGGETLDQFVSRTKRALEDVLSRPEQPVLIVAHGGNLMVLAAALHLHLDQSLFSNALPLRFTRNGSSWDVAPLLAPSTDGQNIA